MNSSRTDDEKILSPEFLDEIKRIRETRGISIEEIAERTNIKTSYIKAIEDGDLSRLPGGIYNKAYIKSVSEFLGINLRPYERSVEADENIKDKEVRVEIGRPVNASIPGKIIIVGCILCIVLLYSLFYGTRVSKQEENNSLVTKYVDKQKTEAAKQIAVAKTPQEKAVVEAELQGKIADQATVIKQIPQISPIKRETENFVNKELVITLVATQASKVTVRDYYGKVIMDKDMTPNEAVMLNGSSEYYLDTANIGNLEIYLDGLHVRNTQLQKKTSGYLLKGEEIMQNADAQINADNAAASKQDALSAPAVNTQPVAASATAPALPSAQPQVPSVQPPVAAAPVNAQAAPAQLKLSPNAIKQPAVSNTANVNSPNANNTQNNQSGSGR